MTVKGLIELLKQCDQECSIVVFTPDAIPYEIDEVITGQVLPHINLKEPEGGMA